MQYPNGNCCNIFTIGLSEPHRQMVDPSCSSKFMTKNEDEAYEHFDTLSDNSMYHAYLTGPPPRSYKRKVVFASRDTQ